MTIENKILQRSFKGDIANAFSFANGEAGEGIYFFVPNRAMREYHAKPGCQIISVTLKSSANIIDLTKTEINNALLMFMDQESKSAGVKLGLKPKIGKNNYHRFGRMIESFVGKNYPNADGWLVLHEGPGIPRGKQVVIRNKNCFEQVQ